MILGVGAGTFAVLLTIGVAVLFAAIGCYLAPDFALFILIGCLALPLIVYGCIISAPRATPEVAPPFSPYRETLMPADSTLIDKFMPVRIVMLLVTALTVFGGVAYQLLSMLGAPAYTVPRMKCLREQLEEQHPSWYR